MNCLLVIAHPDDEALFFAGLLLKKNRQSWTIICATDGNADSNGPKRKKDFKKSCQELGAKSFHFLGLPDLFEKRLNVSLLQKLLHEKIKDQNLHRVYTHGILGEYGHPHHQDVSFAVHQFFFNKTQVWSLSTNAYPEEKITLSLKNFETKSRILTKTYASETSRFLNLLPISSYEGFHRLEYSEVEHLYFYWTKGQRLVRKKLKKYSHLFDFLKSKKKILDQRIF